MRKKEPSTLTSHFSGEALQMLKTHHDKPRHLPPERNQHHQDLEEQWKGEHRSRKRGANSEVLKCIITIIEGFFLYRSMLPFCVAVRSGVLFLDYTVKASIIPATDFWV